MLRDYGGLVCDYSRENKTVGDFYKSLRSGSMSQTVDSSNPGSMYHATKNWLSPKAKRVIKECFVQQLSLTNRLSTPKGQIRQRQQDGTNSLQSLERENGESAQKLPATIPAVRTSLLMRSSQSKRYHGRNLFGGEAQTQQNSGRGSLERLDSIQQVEVESPRKALNDQRQDSQDKMLKDISVRMSINNAKKNDINKNAFSLLRTSLEAS